jgi:hypothetical protein
MYTNNSFGNFHWKLNLASLDNVSSLNRLDLGRAAPYEKALYGSLCGNFDAMMSVCNSQLIDKLWAGSRSLIMTKIY